MARAEESARDTPSRPLSSLQKQNSSAASNKSQRSILGFFSKAVPTSSQASSNTIQKANGLSTTSNGNARLPSAPFKKSSATKAKHQNITPLPSSDHADIPSSQENIDNGVPDEVETGLPSLLTPAKSNIKQDVNGSYVAEQSSPSRRVYFTTHGPSL